MSPRDSFGGRAPPRRTFALHPARRYRAGGARGSRRGGCRSLRQLRIVTYGLSPFPLTPAESRGVHGTDERVSLDALTLGVRFMYDVVSGLDAQ